jgi:signal recognition particle receptor subunit alpha
LKEANFFRDFDFSAEFSKTLRSVEQETKVIDSRQKMRTFEDSAKSKKTIASMIENNKENKSSNNNVQNAPNNKAKGIPEEPVKDDNILDEETRLANLNALKMRKGGPKKKSGVKSPKQEKKGKAERNWDPFMFGGQGATGEEARNLDRGAKSPKAGKGGANEDGDEEVLDHQMSQFVPDASVLGRSASKRNFYT